MSKKEKVAECVKQLIEKTDAFCASHLDSEYQELCRKLIKKMARKADVPFLRGSLDNWAAGVVHALGTINGLFYSDEEPTLRASDIAAYFGVNASTTGQKAARIREITKLEKDPEFATQRRIEHNMRMQDIMLQTLEVLMPDVEADELALEFDSFLFGNDSVIEDEFIDEDRDAMHGYYDLCERCGPAGPTPEMERDVRRVIESDPNFLDSYLMLVAILEQQGRNGEAQKMLDEAHSRALGLLTKKTGHLPTILRWGWLENRHIIRTLLEKAIDSWGRNDTSTALDTFRYLLRSDPGDATGARHYVLAIRLNMSFQDFEERFNQEGLYTEDLPDWFEEHRAKFPDEFEGL